MKIWPLALIILILFSFQNAIAEELDGYEPPPMFGSSTPQQSPDNTSVKKSEEPIQQLSKPMVKPTAKPKRNFAKKFPAKPAATQSVVKGPKVMPAVKKQGVEAEVIFESDAKTSSSLLERAHKKITMEKVSAKKIVKPKKKVILPKNTDQKDWLLDFSEKQTGITKAQENILLQNIVPLLNMSPQAKLFVAASATSSDKTSLNADRRTALSRALNIRSYLLKQKIAPDRIDVRAMGAEDGSIERSNQVHIKLID